MLTILSQIWQHDAKYLHNFISYHVSIGITSFVFVIDEYNLKFDFDWDMLDLSTIYVHYGKSNDPNLTVRQIENFNHCLRYVKDEYVCVLDCDEFLHSKTLNFLVDHPVQALSLPWRIMCLAIPEQRSVGGSYYSGITVPQFKSISKVCDIDFVGVHYCSFTKPGKRLTIGQCSHLPINHYYVRDSSEFLDLSTYISSVDPYFKRRIYTMLLLHSLCLRFPEYGQYFRLTSTNSPTLVKELPKPVSEVINGSSIIYLYLFIKSTFIISRITGLSLKPSIKAYPHLYYKFESTRYPVLKFIILSAYLIKSLFVLYTQKIKDFFFCA